MGGAAPAAGGWPRDDCTGGDEFELSGAVYAGGGDESVPLRILQRQIAGVHVYAADDSEICLEGFGAVAGSDRHSHGGPSSAIQGVTGRVGGGGVSGDSRPCPGSAGAAACAVSPGGGADEGI